MHGIADHELLPAGHPRPARCRAERALPLQPAGLLADTAAAGAPERHAERHRAESSRRPVNSVSCLTCHSQASADANVNPGFGGAVGASWQLNLFGFGRVEMGSPDLAWFFTTPSRTARRASHPAPTTTLPVSPRCWPRLVRSPATLAARTVRFVAFTNEEPPSVRTEAMGSLVHARRSRERGDEVVAMLSVERKRGRNCFQRPVAEVTDALRRENKCVVHSMGRCNTLRWSTRSGGVVDGTTGMWWAF